MATSSVVLCTIYLPQQHRYAKLFIAYDGENTEYEFHLKLYKTDTIHASSWFKSDPKRKQLLYSNIIGTDMHMLMSYGLPPITVNNVSYSWWSKKQSKYIMQLVFRDYNATIQLP